MKIIFIKGWLRVQWFIKWGVPLISLLVVVYMRLSYGSQNRFVFLDIGQGDSTLIQYNGVNVLIDGGPGDSVVYKLDKCLPMWDRDIDLLVLTHPHSDHLEGLLHVLSRHRVKEVWVYPVCYDSLVYSALLESVDGELPTQWEKGGISIEVIAPKQAGIVGQECEGSGMYKPDGKSVNNDSIVLSVSAGGRELLLAGDIEYEAERELLRGGLLWEVDILQAPHHCSKSSNSRVFLQTVNPSLVVCSVGEGNSYGHPSREVIDRLEEMGIDYVVTSQSGDLVVELD